MKRAYVLILLTASFLLIVGADVAAKSKITKESFVSEGKKRTYYLLAPESVLPSKPAPLVVMLHGSGRDGRILVERWQSLAEGEGIILAGPDATSSASWSIPQDGPNFLRDLVEEIKKNRPVNPRRVYLFGHSAGAIFGIYMSLLESKYFAAAALHAGAMRKEDYSITRDAERKIPLMLLVGANDPLFPLPAVRATRDALTAASLPVELIEIPKHDHNYYGRSGEINRAAWGFLAKHELTADPEFKEYQFK